MCERHLIVLEVDDFHQLAESLACAEDAADQLLASAVVRMRLAPEDDLQPSDIPGDRREPLDVGEDQVGALVWRRASCEADRHHCRVEYDAGSFRDDVQ